jgi:hypothetical protein
MTVGYSSTHGQYIAARSRREAVALRGMTCARDVLPKLEKGLSVFGVTRGAFSQIDIILKYMDDLPPGPVSVSVWTWVIAEYEAQVFRRFMLDGRITSGTLVMGGGGRQRSKDKKENHVDWSEAWQATFGRGTVKQCKNHAKICTLSGGGYEILIRGSMNLNMNNNWEQFDVDEGHPGFQLVRAMEAELPEMESGDPVTPLELASGLQLFPTRELKTWRK